MDPPAYLNPQLVDEPLLHIGVKVRQAGTEGDLILMYYGLTDEDVKRIVNVIKL